MCTGQLCVWHTGSTSLRIVRSRQGLHLLFECQQKEKESKTLSLSGSYKLSPPALCRWVLKRVACPQVPLTIYCIDWLDVPDNSLQSAVVSRDLQPDTNCVKTFVTSPLVTQAPSRGQKKTWNITRRSSLCTAHWKNSLTDGAEATNRGACGDGIHRGQKRKHICFLVHTEHRSQRDDEKISSVMHETRFGAKHHWDTLFSCNLIYIYHPSFIFFLWKWFHLVHNRETIKLHRVILSSSICGLLQIQMEE